MIVVIDVFECDTSFVWYVENLFAPTLSSCLKASLNALLRPRSWPSWFRMSLFLPDSSLVVIRLLAGLALAVTMRFLAEETGTPALKQYIYTIKFCFMASCPLLFSRRRALFVLRMSS